MIREKKYLDSNNYSWQDIVNIALEQEELVETIIKKMVKCGKLKSVEGKEDKELIEDLMDYIDWRERREHVFERSEAFFRVGKYSWQDIVRLSLKEDLSVRKTIKKLIRNKVLPTMSKDEIKNSLLYVYVSLMFVTEELEENVYSLYLAKGNLDWNSALRQLIRNNMSAPYTRVVQDLSFKTQLYGLIEDETLETPDEFEVKDLISYIDKQLLRSMKLTQLI